MAQYPSEQPPSSSLKLSDTLESKAHSEQQQPLDAKDEKSTLQNEQIQAFYQTIRKEMVSINDAIREILRKIEIGRGHFDPRAYREHEGSIEKERSKALALSEKVTMSLNSFSKPLPNNFEQFTQEIEGIRHELIELKQLKETISNYTGLIKSLGDLGTRRHGKTPKERLKESLEGIESRLGKQIFRLEKFSSHSLVSLLNTKVSVSGFGQMYLQHIQRVNTLEKIHQELQELYKEVEKEAAENLDQLYEYYTRESIVAIELQERMTALKQAFDAISPELYQGCDAVSTEIGRLKRLISKHGRYYTGDGYTRNILHDKCLDKLSNKISAIQNLWKDETFFPERTEDQCEKLANNLLRSYKEAKAEAKTGLVPYEFLILRMQNPRTVRDTLVGLTAIASVAQGAVILSQSGMRLSSLLQYTDLNTVHDLLDQYCQVMKIVASQYSLGSEISYSVIKANEALKRGSALLKKSSSAVSSQESFFKFYEDNRRYINEIYINIIEAERVANNENLKAPIPRIPAMMFMCSPEAFLLADSKSVLSNLQDASQALKRLFLIIMFYKAEFPVHKSTGYINRNFKILHELIAQCLFSWKMYSNELIAKGKVDFKEVQHRTDQYSRVMEYAQYIYESIILLPFNKRYKYLNTEKEKEKEICNEIKFSFQKLLLCLLDLPESYAQVLNEIDVVRGHFQNLLKTTKSILGNEFYDRVAEIDKVLELLPNELKLTGFSQIIPAKSENKKTEKVVESKLDASTMVFQIQVQNAWSAFNLADEEDKPKYLREMLLHFSELQKVAGCIDMLDPALLAFLEKYSQDELVKEIQKRGGARYIHSEYLQDEKLARKKIDLNNLPKDFIRPMKIVSVLSKDLRAIPSVTPLMLKQLCILEVELLEQELKNLYSKKESQELAGQLKEAFEIQKAITQKEESIEWLQLVMGPSQNAQDLLRVRETLAQVYLNLRETKQGMPKSEYCQALDTLVSELKTEEDVIQKLKELRQFDVDKLRWHFKKNSKNTVASTLLGLINVCHSLHVDLNSPFALFPSDIIALAESKGLRLSVATKDEAYAQEAENYRFKYEQYMQTKAENSAFDQRVANKFRAAMNKALGAVQDIGCLNEALHGILKASMSEGEYRRRYLLALKVAPEAKEAKEVKSTKSLDSLGCKDLYKLSMDETDGVLAWKYFWLAVRKDSWAVKGQTQTEWYSLRSAMRSCAQAYLKELEKRLLPASTNASEWRVDQEAYNDMRPVAMIRELEHRMEGYQGYLQQTYQTRDRNYIFTGDDEACCLSAIDNLRVLEARVLDLEIKALKKALELEKEAKKDSDKPEDIQSIILKAQEISRKEKAMRCFLVEVGNPNRYVFLDEPDQLTVENRLWVGTTLAEQLEVDPSIQVYIRAKYNLSEAAKLMSENQLLPWSDNAASEHLKALDERIKISPKFKQLKEVIDALDAGKLKEILDDSQKIFESERSVVRHVMRPSFSPLDIIDLAKHLGNKWGLDHSEEFKAAKKWAGELNQAQQACRHWYEWREAKDVAKKQEHHAAMTKINEAIKTSVLYPKLQALFEGRLAPDIKSSAPKPVSSSSSSSMGAPVLPERQKKMLVIDFGGESVDLEVEIPANNPPPQRETGSRDSEAAIVENKAPAVSKPKEEAARAWSLPGVVDRGTLNPDLPASSVQGTWWKRSSGENGNLPVGAKFSSPVPELPTKK